MKTKISLSNLILIVTLASASAYADPKRQLVVFGDSLSDPGNYFALFQDLEIQPFEASPSGTAFVPSAPYAIGGGHFTNGATWVEKLAQMLGSPQSGSPAAIAPQSFTNYAVGRSRARANPVGVFNAVDFTAQVDAFLSLHNNQASAEPTYVLWIGSNDVADALLLSDGSLIAGALQNIAVQVNRLYLGGARSFLFVNVPNLANTPRVQELADASGPAHDLVLAGAELASISFNLGQLGLIAFLQSSLPGIEAELLDVFAILEDVVADPEPYGLTDIDHACVTSDTQGKSICSQPSEYLFWDGQHPTETVHGLLAEAALGVVAD